MQQTSMIATSLPEMNEMEGGRRHGRNISHSIPQPAERGPLDDDNDDDNDPTTTSSPPPLPPKQETPRIHVQFLQDARIYHPLPTDDIPNAFLTSNHRPAPDTPLPQLLAGGHFRRAADSAARSLLQCDPIATLNILQLFYTRLACLILIQRPDIAAAEAQPLESFLARAPPESLSAIPWDLRLLLVRLQSIGAPDGGRRGIMSLYALAAEARSHLRQARATADTPAINLWSDNLLDLGLRVCDALVEMGELETATRHLDTLVGVDAEELAHRKSLLRIRVGDIAGARQTAAALSSPLHKAQFSSLLQISDGDYSAAAQTLQNLIAESPSLHSLDLFAQNAAVTLLYTGQITSAKNVLEDLAARGPIFPTLLFNLCTLYELLGTERGGEGKGGFIQKCAAREPGPESGGWERSAGEFKL